MAEFGLESQKNIYGSLIGPGPCLSPHPAKGEGFPTRTTEKSSSPISADNDRLGQRSPEQTNTSPSPIDPTLRKPFQIIRAGSGKGSGPAGGKGK